MLRGLRHIVGCDGYTLCHDGDPAGKGSGWDWATDCADCLDALAEAAGCGLASFPPSVLPFTRPRSGRLRRREHRRRRFGTQLKLFEPGADR